MADYRTRLNVGPQKTDVYFAASDVGLVPNSDAEYPVLALKTDGTTCGWISAKFTPYEGTRALRVSVEKAPDDDENSSRSSDTIWFYSDGADTSSTANAFFEIGNIEQSYLPGSSGCLSATETALLDADTPSTSVGVYMVHRTSIVVPKLGIAKGVNAVAEVELGSVGLDVLGGPGGHVVSYNLRSGVTETDDCLVVIDETSTDGYAPLRLATRIYCGVGENSDVSNPGTYAIVYPESSSGSSTTVGEFVVEPTTMSVPASGGSFSYFVPSRSTTGSTISVSSGATWLSAESLSSSDTAGVVSYTENTDGVERTGVLTLTEEGGTFESRTITVYQAAGTTGEVTEDEWTGSIPSGNAPGGGTEEKPTLSDSGSRIWWRGAGADDVIRAETDVSGGVNSEGGESWRITLKMRRERAVKFVKTSALFVGSVWQPVPLPSRNKPAICGWDVSYQGQIATVEIRYEIVAGRSYNYSTPEAPVESRYDAVSHAVTERPLSECKAIFGDSKPEDNAIIVEWCKKYIQAIDPTLSADERKTATDNFFAALSDGAKKTKDEFLNSPAAKAVLTCLRSGQDSFLAYTATVARTEILNTKPAGVGNGVGKYGTPASSLVSGGRWLLVSDDLKQTSAGQYERERTWQKAEIESEAYE